MPLQSEFTRGDSTVYQLVDIYKTFCQALDEGRKFELYFVISVKPLTGGWHRGLIAKLKHYGINGPLLAWFESYQTNRRNREILPNGTSDWKEIKAVVP